MDKIKRLAATEDRQEEPRLPNEERYVDKGLTGTGAQLKEGVINHHEAPGKYQLQKPFTRDKKNCIFPPFFKTGALPLRRFAQPLPWAMGGAESAGI